jgi:hypothetical protein
MVKSNTFELYYIHTMIRLSQNRDSLNPFFTKGTTSILANTTNITTLWGC